MAETTPTGPIVAEVMAEPAGLEGPKTREVNERHGDDHGVNLGKLRALAKRLKTQQELAYQLWETGDTAARLCLAQIGIEHAEHRARAMDIGERLEVLKDHPASPGCTSPFAPVWISEMVRRRRDAGVDRRAHPPVLDALAPSEVVPVSGQVPCRTVDLRCALRLTV